MNHTEQLGSTLPPNTGSNLESKSWNYSSDSSPDVSKSHENMKTGREISGPEAAGSVLSWDEVFKKAGHKYKEKKSWTFSLFREMLD